MALVHVTAVRNSLAGIISTAVDAGAGAGKIQITKLAGDYTGANLLAEIVLSDPAFGAASGGTITAAGLPVEDASANNTGTAVEFRQVDSTDAEVYRGTVTATAGGGDMEMSSTAITAGDAVRLNTYTYSASA